jgi:predicted NAD-dependent protein-ADP-ribosyltransferase YbiA (DUF1768 family)
MEKVLEMKLAAHPQMKEELLNTFPRKLVYTSERDDYWGYSMKEWGGRNHLGRILEVIRSRLVKELIQDASG